MVDLIRRSIGDHKGKGRVIVLFCTLSLATLPLLLLSNTCAVPLVMCSCERCFHPLSARAPPPPFTHRNVSVEVPYTLAHCGSDADCGDGGVCTSRGVCRCSFALCGTLCDVPTSTPGFCWAPVQVAVLTPCLLLLVLFCVRLFRGWCVRVRVRVCVRASVRAERYYHIALSVWCPVASQHSLTVQR